MKSKTVTIYQIIQCNLPNDLRNEFKSLGIRIGKGSLVRACVEFIRENGMVIMKATGEVRNGKTWKCIGDPDVTLWNIPFAVLGKKVRKKWISLSDREICRQLKSRRGLAPFSTIEDAP